MVAQPCEYTSVQSLGCVRLFATPTAAHQASLSITNSQSSPKLKSIESVMPFNHLILCCPLLLLPSIFPCIRVFSNEPVLRIRWPKCWRKGYPVQGPKLGFCLTLGNELSKEARVLTKQEILLGKGTWMESSRIREPRRTVLPCGSKSPVLW